MAVPKKRKSKSKTKIRKTVWKQKGFKQLTQIFSKIQLTKKKKSNSPSEGLGISSHYNKIEDDQSSN